MNKNKNWDSSQQLKQLLGRPLRLQSVSIGIFDHSSIAEWLPITALVQSSSCLVRVSSRLVQSQSNSHSTMSLWTSFCALGHGALKEEKKMHLPKSSEISRNISKVNLTLHYQQDEGIVMNKGHVKIVHSRQ